MKLLAKITEKVKEIEYKQQHQLKKPHQILIKELTKQLKQSSKEIVLNGVQNFTLQDFYFVFHNRNRAIFYIKILTFQERSQEIREVAIIFNNSQALSINNLQIQILKLNELIELKVLSVVGNQLRNLEGLPPNSVQLYAQNNLILVTDEHKISNNFEYFCKQSQLIELINQYQYIFRSYQLYLQQYCKFQRLQTTFIKIFSKFKRC